MVKKRKPSPYYHKSTFLIYLEPNSIRVKDSDELWDGARPLGYRAHTYLSSNNTCELEIVYPSIAAKLVVDKFLLLESQSFFGCSLPFSDAILVENFLNHDSLHGLSQTRFPPMCWWGFSGRDFLPRELERLFHGFVFYVYLWPTCLSPKWTSSRICVDFGLCLGGKEKHRLISALLVG